MPTKTEWNNFAEVLWTFLVHYCAAEGITQSSEMYVLVRNYIFHGKYNFVRTNKDDKRVHKKDIIHGLHFKLTSGRSRYVNNVNTHFNKFLKLFRKNNQWKTFFNDRGDGNPPASYLAAIEEGFRSYGSDKFTMGRSALKSRKRWGSVSKWRKREAYITLVRSVEPTHSHPQHSHSPFIQQVDRQHVFLSPLDELLIL